MFDVKTELKKARDNNRDYIIIHVDFVTLEPVSITAKNLLEGYTGLIALTKFDESYEEHDIALMLSSRVTPDDILDMIDENKKFAIRHRDRLAASMPNYEHGKQGMTEDEFSKIDEKNAQMWAEREVEYRKTHHPRGWNGMDIEARMAATEKWEKKNGK